MGILHGRQFNKNDYGGMIHPAEAAMLYHWSSQLKNNSAILEIGCNSGLSSCYLLSGLVKNKGFLYAVDPFNTSMNINISAKSNNDKCATLPDKPSVAQVKTFLENSGFKEKFELIQGFSEEVARTWTKPIDFLQINDQPEQAHENFMAFLPYLTKNARVAVRVIHSGFHYKNVIKEVEKIFSQGQWCQMERVKSITTGILKTKPIP